MCGAKSPLILNRKVGRFVLAPLGYYTEPKYVEQYYIIFRFQIVYWPIFIDTSIYVMSSIYITQTPPSENDIQVHNLFLGPICCECVFDEVSRFKTKQMF